MTTRWLSVLLLSALPMLAPAQQEQPEAPRQIDLRQAPPNFRLGMRVLTHRHARQASPVLVIADSSDAYAEALGRWTDKVIFPVLIDDGSVRASEDIGRFVRAFKPERVVRFAGTTPLPEAREARREHLERTLAGVWGLGKPEVAADEVMTELVSHLQFAVHLPPGIVVADTGDPAWTAALALAAGHAQPIMWYDRSGIAEKIDGSLTHAQTAELVGAIETRLEELGLPWQGLGDATDAITLCLNVPAKCQLDMGENAGERFALTDVVGQHRALTSGRFVSLQRWAWAGQVFGTESEAAYRAMCGLFVQPSRAWVFDGYPTTAPWNTYDGTLTAENLGKANLPATLLDTPRNGVDSWFASTTLPLDADAVFVNTKGLADYFDLEPGRAYSSDVPVLARPAAVSYVHSWSANRPGDPASIAGAWLRNGAHMYVGSVHEPFLQAFIPTPVFTLRLMGGLPWGVACRSDGPSPIWKIAVLGDPLLAIGAERPRAPVMEFEGGTPVSDEIPEAIKAEDFVRTVRTQVMLGKDGDAVRLASALEREREEVFDGALAEAVAMAAFRAHNKELLVACSLKLTPERLRETGIAQALWHIAESDLRAGVDNRTASALERSLGGPSIARDAARLAGAVELTQGVNIRNVLVDRIADSVTDPSVSREIRKARR